MNNTRKKQFNSRWNKTKKNKRNYKSSTNIDNTYHNFNNNQCLPIASTSFTRDQLKQKIKHENSYFGWDLYFYDEEYKKNSTTLQKVQTMEKFLKANPKLNFQNDFINTLKIDVNFLYNSKIFLENWPDFKIELKNKPRYTLNCLGLAVYKVRIERLEKITKIIDNETINALATVRILNYDPIVSLKDIKVNYYGKLITVRGCIIRVNRSYNMPSVLIILCNNCKLPYSVKQKYGIYSIKKVCNICGGIKFEPDISSPYIETIPIQVVRLQEHIGEENDDKRQIPRIIDIELYEDLVGTCMPGDDVTITGIIKMQGLDNGKIKVNTVSSLYIEAVSVINNNSKTKSNEILSIEFSTEIYKLVKDIHMSLDKLTLLVNSLCPSIYGHEMIKMAFLLSLFGGSSKHVNLRDNIHILVLGDPGLGKSQMLQACAHIAPKGIYISGNSSTSSGLTVTLVKAAGQNDFALEPGALVLSDKGFCCIDEFDKMSTQHQALLEAMEQQSVSVAKSGVIWSLPSRTSILAAANPIGGHYDKSKSLCKNVNMSTPLLSRFDLIFLLLDEPGKDLDNFLSGHVLLTHTGNMKTKNENFSTHNRYVSNQMNSLKNRLIATSKDSIVPSSLLRMYISYARQYVRPRLSSVSATILQKFYLSLRKMIDVSGNLLPCNRQLEALIRLTEARAKLDLREETTEQDAIDVIELMQHTVLYLSNEKVDHKFLQINKIYKNATKIFLKLLMKNSNLRNNSLYSIEELQNLGLKGGLVKSDVSFAIEKLNDHGFLIKKSNNLYSFSAP